MGLSESERKLLEQLEASLMAEDPAFAHRIGGAPRVRMNRRGLASGIVGIVAGLALLVGGVQLHWLVSVGGFVVLLLGVLLLQAARPQQAPRSSSRAPHGPAANSERPPRMHPDGSSTKDFLDQLDERWKRRHDGEA